jgi:hypothetical protein
MSAGWRIDLPPNSVQCAGVDHVLVLTDRFFPKSQPRVVAPQAGGSYNWPHVELNGVLCLKSTKLACDAGSRIIQHLRWAYELLNFSEINRRREFVREFATYWRNRASDKSSAPEVLSLLNSGGDSREIVYNANWSKGRVVVAEGRAELMNWLRNSGENPSDKDILTTWMCALPEPWTPAEYPEFGRDVLNLLPEQMLKTALNPGKRCPFIFSVNTQTGVVFAAVVLEGAAVKALSKGFRNLSRVPQSLIENSFGSRELQRCSVSRVDGSWIHGRDHDPSFPAMRTRTVAIIGCGSLGSAIARVLAQSGVANFILVDADGLSSANISRHTLGMRHVGKNKANATAEMICEDFPHVKMTKSYAKRFESLSLRELAVLSSVDLIVSAGINFDGDASLDNWRRSLTTPPAHLCTWVEEFAIVGHAVLLYGTDSLLTGFDKGERPIFRMTEWAEKSKALLVEAGCGNVFQPHGVVDLQSTVSLAAGLAIDVLLAKVPISCRRVWQGDRQAVEAKGGHLSVDFIESFVVRHMPWP